LKGGLKFDMSDSAALMLDYTGELSATGQTHAIKATFGGRF
jgi:hypothetical protein